MIYSNLKALEWSQHFSHYKSIEIFSKRSKAAKPKVQGLMWPNLEPIQAFMVDLFTCKNKEGARVVTTIAINPANSIIGDGTLTKFKLI